MVNKNNIIYQIFDPITNKKYIGSKYQYEGVDTYFGSSRNIEMKDIIRERKETLIFEILEDNIPKESLKTRELYYQVLNNVVKDENFWNLRYVTNWHGYMLGRNHSEETKKKMSIAHKNNIVSEYTKQLISNKLVNIFKEKGKNYWTLEGFENLRQICKRNFTGTIFSEDHKKKIGLSKKDKPLSEDHKKNTSNTMKKKYNNKEIQNGMSKNVNRLDLEMNIIETFESLSEIERKYSIRRLKIANTIKNKSILLDSYWEFKK